MTLCRATTTAAASGRAVRLAMRARDRVAANANAANATRVDGRRRTLASRVRRHHAPRRAATRTATTPIARLAGVVDVKRVSEVAGAAALEVSKSVRMRGVEAPDVDKSYVARSTTAEIDADGLPLVYNKEQIQKYWDKQGGALQKRWAEFLSLSVPFLTKVATLAITGGSAELSKNDRALAKDARIIIEKLGPTYIKAGQMMSVRPDVLPQAALDELAVLQDSVKPFATATAIETIESELEGPLSDFFDEISEDPVAAASLAQVYRAKLKGKDEYVAVKVQRPQILDTVSKDLYVLRRAAEVYQGLIERFAPQQRTDYVGLLNEWAVGFYTELDFLNEAANQQKLRDLLQQEQVKDIYVPEVKHELCTRRVLVTEWMDGIKLSECEPTEIRDLVGIGQECFLVQLLQVGFFHSDPHPGNLMKLNDASKGKLAILDFGLVASIQQQDMDTMVSSIIHLANKDYPSLVDDFIALKILPDDCDRAKVVPLMDKALSPYVKGGGAKKYEAELKRMYNMDGSLSSTAGGFQAMTQDLLTVLNDIPFSIPPYFALLGRAVVTLEGIALLGNPDYRLVMEAYPFVARKLLREDRPEAQRALQEVLYASTQGGGSILQGRRLAVMLNSAMGIVAKNEDVFVDLETIPEDAATLDQSLKYLLQPQAASLRNLLEREAETAADLLLRQSLRKGVNRVFSQLPKPPSWLPFTDSLPNPRDVSGPVLLPVSGSSTPVPALASPGQLLDLAAPQLDLEEEVFALSLGDLAAGLIGKDAATVLMGDAFLEPEAVAALFLSIVATGELPVGTSDEVRRLAANARDSLRQVTPEGEMTEEQNFEDLISAVQKLDTEERDVLQESTTRVINRVYEKICARLIPITGGPPVAAQQNVALESR